jgi:hypothetical protein
MNRKPFEIPNIIDSLRRDLDTNIITIDEAAKELYQSGWTNFIDVERTRKILD